MNDPMLLPSMKEKLDIIGTDMWHYDGPDFDFDLIAQTLSRLQTQLKVQKRLHVTAETLRRPTLPSQKATRVKHFLKFVFERTTRGNNRHLAFRQLDCNTLTFCGLSYKIKDIIELPQTQFEFLVQNVSEFVQRRKLEGALYCDEIDNMASAKLNAEDEELYRNFLKARIDLRPKKRKRPSSVCHRLQQDQRSPQELPRSPRIKPPSDAQLIQINRELFTDINGNASSPDATSTIIMTEQYDTKEDAATNRPPFLLPHPLALLDLANYCSFSFMSRQLVENIPEPFRAGLKTSKGWSQENDQGGLAVTNGVTILLPEVCNEDSFFFIRMGYESGFHIANSLGIGDKIS